MTIDIKNKLKEIKEKGYVIFDPVMTAELKAKVMGKDFFILDCSSNGSASWTEWEHLSPKVTGQNTEQGFRKHDRLEGAAASNIFEPFASEQESATEVFFARPGAGQVLYSDMLRPRQAAQEVNRILDAVPLVEQNHLEYKGLFIEIEMSHVEVH